MTPKQKVKNLFPEAFAGHSGEWWLIYQHYLASGPMGSGSTPKKAWADAAKRMARGR
jgi:hypothetical protein